MWRTIQRCFLVVGAFLTVLVYSLQFRKACEEATPYQCVVNVVMWAGQGMLTARADATQPPTPTENPRVAVETPKPNPPGKPDVVEITELVRQASSPPVQNPNVASETTKGPVPLKQVSSNPMSVAKAPNQKHQRVDNHDRRVTIKNAGDEPVENVYASGCHERTWVRDWLGEYMIGAGDTHTFDFDDGKGTCCFDLRVSFEGGTKRTNMGVDVCKTESWTVSNR